MNTGKKEDFKLVEKLILQALSIDSSFATAHARLSDIYGSYALVNADLYGASKKSEEMLNLQKVHLEKAYALNPNSDFINAAKAGSFLKFEHSDVDSLYYYIKKALMINPNNPEILEFAATYLYYWYLGLDEEAIEICNKIIDIDPLNIEVLFTSTLRR